jgi:bifunctional DNA-binding transcriptional regulator/antitoxin component of YhaV-PrlF toxin-antitoxin module
MAKKTHTRNLLKFSHYSTVIVLPKALLNQLAWVAGDAVEIRVNPKTEELILSRTSSEVTVPPCLPLRSPAQAGRRVVAGLLGGGALETRESKVESAPTPEFDPEAVIPIPEID